MLNSEPRIGKVKDGWAAYGNGWAVHAPTKEEAEAKFTERKEFYKRLEDEPYWYENPKNPALAHE